MFYGVAYGFKKAKDTYDYLSDLHPTETQYKHQKQFAGANPLYDSWMRGRAEDEWTNNQRQVLGIGWNDISNPWLAGLSGGNAAYAMGRAVNSSMNVVSKNIMDLYGNSDDGPRIGQSRKAWQKEQDWNRRRYRR